MEEKDRVWVMGEDNRRHLQELSPGNKSLYKGMAIPQGNADVGEVIDSAFPSCYPWESASLPHCLPSSVSFFMLHVWYNSSYHFFSLPAGNSLWTCPKYLKS